MTTLRILCALSRERSGPSPRSAGGTARGHVAVTIPLMPLAEVQVDETLDARCLSCGYRLWGLPSNRCPECGRAFDLKDPWTVWLPGRPNRLARWLNQPPSRLVRSWPIAGLLAVAWGTSIPGFEHFWLRLGAVLLISTLAGVIAWKWALNVVRRRGYPDGGVGPEWDRWWRTVSRMSALALVLVLLRPTMYARFWLSYPWLAPVAARIEAQPFSKSAPYVGKVRGLFYIGHTRRCPHGVKIKVTPKSNHHDGGPGFFHRTDAGRCERFDLDWPLGGGWYATD